MSEEKEFTASALGQIAFAEYYGRQAGAALDMPASWDMQSDAGRADWEAAAAAVAAHIASPTADGFDGDSSGLDIKRDGRVIATYPGEHSWLSAREEGATTADPYFTQGKKLAIALDALREMREHGDEAASEALAQIEDVDL